MQRITSHGHATLEDALASNGAITDDGVMHSNVVAAKQRPVAFVDNFGVVHGIPVGRDIDKTLPGEYLFTQAEVVAALKKQPVNIATTVELPNQDLAEALKHAAAAREPKKPRGSRAEVVAAVGLGTA